MELNHYNTKKNTYLSLKRTTKKNYSCQLCEITTVYASLNGFQKHIRKFHPDECQKEYSKFFRKKRKPIFSDSRSIFSTVNLNNNTSSSSNDSTNSNRSTEINFIFERPEDNYSNNKSSDNEFESEYDNNEHGLTLEDAIIVEDSTNERNDTNPLTNVERYSVEEYAAAIETHMRVAESHDSVNQYPHPNSVEYTRKQAILQSVEQILKASDDSDLFKSKVELILLTLFRDIEGLSAEIQMNRIMFAMELLLEVREAVGEKLDFPRPEAVISHHLQLKNNIFI
ncbi:hypothetical protein J3Q64DRAFT_1699778 [Phycomyces blakesleeanus]|uniref:Uncharacterized protein n=2 Tax=Phycomyces blakesleeanus TaxID=4837 RepID=A0A162NA12_PHYB8|nr:hypothetical protein PHYBLDRAFT_146698 [Phycomyces blakesleeanus NRRL 1555(-)]OAD72508.1 hypothetical protein PHYBLDRAFT_146698 [Phycomyces blakesleeanus NRRL 1555(-)]|eukprot:XP_018290548.1 hypothetical protein PHYBLDRAFT_146698 [Phycomyces blakesleeanus NRRL 1555(-)]